MSSKFSTKKTEQRAESRHLCSFRTSDIIGDNSFSGVGI